MAYTSSQGREQLLVVVGSAADRLGAALGLLTGAFELLDERNAERLEEELFRPVQLAYGRARRAHAEFAARYDLAGRSFQPAAPGAPARGATGLVQAAMDAVGEADAELGTLQDSMLPVEVGDAELRAELEQVRLLIGGLRGRARELLRTLGR